jgi:hypothetical protein
MKRQIGNRLEEGKTLSHLGLLYWGQASRICPQQSESGV